MPINFSDPFGLCPDCLVDAAFLAADLNDIRKNGWSWGRGLALGADLVGAAVPFVPAIAGVVSRSATTVARTRWGWEGASAHRAALNQLSRPGTHIDVGGIVPRRQEAERLIHQAGGKIERIQRAHAVRGHPYPHINYLTEAGEKATLRVEGVGREFIR